nr:MAG TPA: hypothetical protein [Caudoviricetes sp.]
MGEKKIEGVRFPGDNVMLQYVLCMDGKCNREIWVDVAEFKRGVRKFGYSPCTREAEKVKLSPKQETRVSAYLQEYARFREDFRKYEEALRIAEEAKRKLKAECPTFCAQFAGRIDAEILP